MNSHSLALVLVLALALTHTYLRLNSGTLNERLLHVPDVPFALGDDVVIAIANQVRTTEAQCLPTKCWLSAVWWPFTSERSLIVALS